MRARVRALLALVVVAGTVVVLAGAGQGAPPPAMGTLSAAAERAQAERVAKGSHGVQVGRRLFVTAGCSACHTVASADAEGKLGPRLDVVLQGNSRAGIKELIVNPKVVMLPGYDNGLMPRDYASRLTGGELRALASFLATAAG